jgi:hypothetical protein
MAKAPTKTVATAPEAPVTTDAPVMTEAPAVDPLIVKLKEVTDTEERLATLRREYWDMIRESIASNSPAATA